VGRHSIPDPGDPLGGPGEERPARQGRRRRADGGPRGVSTGVIAAVATVVALVTAVILWQFFGDALSRRAGQAAGQCLAGTDTVPVVADASIAEQVREFAGRFNDETGPVGDTCVEVVVTEAESDAVVTGLTGTWSADAGEQPALWIPASSVSPARLQAAVGPQVVSDARSLATSPVTLAVRPQLRDALGTLGWPALPGLQTNPTALDGLGLPDWGSLRLALPSVGGADSAYLVAEAVAATSAPPGSPVTSAPSSRMRPALGVSNPASRRNSVVLPQPDGPSRVKNSPPPMVKYTPSSARTPAAPWPKVFDTACTSIIGPPPPVCTDGRCCARPGRFCKRSLALRRITPRRCPAHGRPATGRASPVLPPVPLPDH